MMFRNLAIPTTGGTTLHLFTDPAIPDCSFMRYPPSHPSHTQALLSIETNGMVGISYFEEIPMHISFYSHSLIKFIMSHYDPMKSPRS